MLGEGRTHPPVHPMMRADEESEPLGVHSVRTNHPRTIYADELVPGQLKAVVFGTQQDVLSATITALLVPLLLSSILWLGDRLPLDAWSHYWAGDHNLYFLYVLFAWIGFQAISALLCLGERQTSETHDELYWDLSSFLVPVRSGDPGNNNSTIAINPDESLAILRPTK